MTEVQINVENSNPTAEAIKANLGSLMDYAQKGEPYGQNLKITRSEKANLVLFDGQSAGEKQVRLSLHDKEVFNGQEVYNGNTLYTNADRTSVIGSLEASLFDIPPYPTREPYATFMVSGEIGKLPPNYAKAVHKYTQEKVGEFIPPSPSSQ